MKSWVMAFGLLLGCEPGEGIVPVEDAGDVVDTSISVLDAGAETEMPDGGAPVAKPDGGAIFEPDAGERDSGAPDAETPDAGETPGFDLGEGDGSDVVTIGDSYMRLPNAFQQPGTEGVELSLERAAGRTYRKFGYTGGSIFPRRPVAELNGVIPGQFEAARAQNPSILTVVATGGGNDLTEDCNGPTTIADLNAACRALLDQIDAAIDAMLVDMANAGVQDVVWVGYGDTATSGRRVFAGALAYLREKRMLSCTRTNPSLGLRCHYVDNAARPGLMTRDGFHPDPAGYDLIGRAVWERMEAEGVRR